MITWNQYVIEAQFSELDISAQELYHLLYAEIPNIGVYIVKYSGKTIFNVHYDGRSFNTNKAAFDNLKLLSQYLVQKVLDKNFKIEYISAIKVRGR